MHSKVQTSKHLKPTLALVQPFEPIQSELATLSIIVEAFITWRSNLGCPLLPKLSCPAWI